MALVVPITSAANVIENILFKVRRGIALSRNASQANPTQGVMADLPSSIDFEMTLLKNHQSLERQIEAFEFETGGDLSQDQSIAGESEFESNSKTLQGSGSSSDSTTKTDSDSDSRTSSATETSSVSEVNALSFSENENSISASSQSSSISKSGSQGSSDSGSGSQTKCTYQEHRANREYDKFDTDTGAISGVGI